jgi:hypothetical protein
MRTVEHDSVGRVESRSWQPVSESRGSGFSGFVVE